MPTPTLPPQRHAPPKNSVLVYHGTTCRFGRFRPRRSGLHFGTFDQAVHAATLKLGRMPPRQFASLPEDTHGFRGIILTVRLQFNALKRVNDARTPQAWARVLGAAHAEGYDALVYANQFEGRHPTDSFVVLHPDQAEILSQHCPCPRCTPSSVVAAV